MSKERKCNINQFTCKDMSCISKYLKCDGKSDCKDRSDEMVCG